MAPKTRFSDLLGECDALRTGRAGSPVTVSDVGCAGCTGLVPIVDLGSSRGGFGEGRRGVHKLGDASPSLGVMAFGEGR